MRVVTRMTGLNADTIRAWERRYHAITPRRTGGNTRMFSAADVHRLTLLREVTEAGHAIGTVATLPDAELEALLDRRAASEPAAADLLATERLVEQYLAAVASFEARKAHDLLLRAAAVLTARDFVFELALPILRAVGDRWARGVFGVSHEHLVSHQLVGLLSTLARLHPPDRGARRVVVATPSGHHHAFGALVGALLATIRGLEVVYLGADVPDGELLRATAEGRVDALILALLVQPGRDEAGRLYTLLGQLPERAAVWLGMPPEVAFTHPRAERFTAFEDLELALTELAR